MPSLFSKAWKDCETETCTKEFYDSKGGRQRRFCDDCIKERNKARYRRGSKKRRENTGTKGGSLPTHTTMVASVKTGMSHMANIQKKQFNNRMEGTP